MTVHDPDATAPRRTGGRIAAADPDRLLDRMAAQAAEWEIDATRRPGALSVKMVGTRAELRAEADGLSLHLAGRDAAQLHVLREAVDRFCEPFGLLPDWEPVPAGGLPPNLSILTVGSVLRLSPHFARLRLTGDGAARLSVNGLHLRLLVPPEGQAPDWPQIGADGRTRWPGGEAALHRPVYTVRAVGPGWIDIDIFLHDGGRTTAWVLNRAPGDAVGVMGPGGGWIPQAGWIGLYGDATALPAIARILSLLPQETRGEAIIRLDDPADRQPIAAPPGIALRWLGAQALSDALRTAALPATDRFVWFAAERAEAEAARQFLRDAGLGREESYVSGYWTA